MNNTCKECIYHCQLMSHPWVDGKRMSNCIGWCCIYFMKERKVIMSNEKSIGCEMFEKKGLED